MRRSCGWPGGDAMTTGQHIAAGIALVPAAALGVMLIGAGASVIIAAVWCRIRIDFDREPRGLFNCGRRHRRNPSPPPITIATLSCVCPAQISVCACRDAQGRRRNAGECNQ